MFWGVSAYTRLGKHLRLTAQVPLLHFVERHEAFGKIRVPQSGWFEESGPSAPAPRHGHGPFRDSYKRTFRQARVHRFEDSLINAREHRLPHTLFSTLQPVLPFLAAELAQFDGAKSALDRSASA